MPRARIFRIFGRQYHQEFCFSFDKFGLVHDPIRRRQRNTTICPAPRAAVNWTIADDRQRDTGDFLQ